MQGPYQDISVPIGPELVVWPGDPQPAIELVSGIAAGEEYNVTQLSLGAHNGTHVDAPWHKLPNGARTDSLRFSDLIGPCLVCDLGELDHNVEAADLDHASIPEDVDRLLLRTANSRNWARPRHAFDPNFIGLAPSGAEWIVRRGIRLVGIDYLSVEPYAGDGTVHRILLEAGVVPLETLDLHLISPGWYTLICLPLRLSRADGAPCRAVLAPLDRDQ